MKRIIILYVTTLLFLSSFNASAQEIKFDSFIGDNLSEIWNYWELRVASSHFYQGKSSFFSGKEMPYFSVDIDDDSWDEFYCEFDANEKCVYHYTVIGSMDNLEIVIARLNNAGFI